MNRPIVFSLAFLSLVFFGSFSSLAQPLEGTGDAVETDPSETASIEQFMQILSAWGPSRAPDGSVYFVTFTTGVDQLYRIVPDGSEPVQVSTFEDGIDSYELSPDGRFIAMVADVGGSEQGDIFLYEVETETLTPCLENPEIRFENPRWWPDSAGFFYRSNEGNGTDFFIYQYELASASASLVLEAPGWNSLGDISDDGTRFLVTRYESNANSDVFMLTFGEDGAVSETFLTPHEGDVLYESPFFTPDGSIWVGTDRDADLLGIGQLVGETGEVIYQVQSQWEVEGLLVSRDRQVLAYVTNEDGYGRVHLFDLTTGDELTPPALDEGIVSVGDFVDQHLLVVYQSPILTGDIWDYDLTTGDLSQMTFSDYAGIDRSLFRNPTLVRYPTFDGREIPGFLFLPPDYDGTILPTIIHAHGGPESQTRPNFIRHFQYLILNGFAVFAPNIRGSSGYGPEYMALDNVELRRDSIRDINAAVVWLIEQGYTDEDHLGIKGGSYGGYVVMAAITEMPERFAAACEEVGIVNFVTFLENTADYRRALREAEYGSLSDREFLESISPLNRIDQIQAPLLVIHGENDTRVPVGEARQVIEGLEARGMPVESLIFENEGHGVSRLENRLVMYRMMVDFFTRHLVGESGE